MSLIESLSIGALQLRADAGGAPPPWDGFWYGPAGGQSSAAGIRVSPEGAKRLGTAVACVSARAKAVAILPGKVRTDKSGGGSMIAADHPWYRAIAVRPNPIQTAFDFRYMMNAHVDLRGNAYAQKVMGEDGWELWPMHPDRVIPEIVANTGRMRYRYNDPLTNQTRVLLQSEVFHLRDWSDSMWIGQSRISMGLDVLGLALSRQDYMARYLKNDARGGLVITGTNFKNKEDEQDYIKSIRAARTGSNAGGTLLLPNGLDIKDLGVKPIDQQLLEGQKASAVEICTLFGVLPHLVGVDAGKSATYASVEQFNIMHAQQCVHPMVVMWEQAYQRDLIDDDRFYVKLSMASLLRGDNATRFAGYAVAIQNSWMCPDDVRALEDMNPIPNGAGKVFWRSTNLVPLLQLANPSQQPAAAPVEDADAAEDGSGGDTGTGALAVADPAMRGRLELLATGAADRCVRKEVSALRKLVEKVAGVFEVAEFYADHARFVVQVFHMDATTALQIKIAYDQKAQDLSALIGDEDDEFQAGAQVWVETVAATETARLVALAVKGVVL